MATATFAFCVPKIHVGEKDGNCGERDQGRADEQIFADVLGDVMAACSSWTASGDVPTGVVSARLGSWISFMI